MGEYGPHPEGEKPSVLSGDFSDLTNPVAYLDAAKRGIAMLRQLFSSAE